MRRSNSMSPIIDSWKNSITYNINSHIGNRNVGKYNEFEYAKQIIEAYCYHSYESQISIFVRLLWLWLIICINFQFVSIIAVHFISFALVSSMHFHPLHIKTHRLYNSGLLGIWHTAYYLARERNVHSSNVHMNQTNKTNEKPFGYNFTIQLI